MPTSPRIPFLAIAVAIIFGSAGCTADTSAAVPETTPSPSSGAATTTPSPSSPPSEAAEGAEATWLISEDGVGPITIGDSREAVQAALAGEYTLESTECPNPGMDFYAPIDPADARLTTASREDGTVAAIVIGGFSPPATADRPRTLEGIGLGATEAELLAAYPGIERGAIRNETVYTSKSDDDVWTTYFFEDGMVSSIHLLPGALPPYEYCG